MTLVFVYVLLFPVFRQAENFVFAKVGQAFSWVLRIIPGVGSQSSTSVPNPSVQLPAPELPFGLRRSTRVLQEEFDDHGVSTRWYKETGDTHPDKFAPGALPVDIGDLFVYVSKEWQDASEGCRVWVWRGTYWDRVVTGSVHPARPGEYFLKLEGSEPKWVRH